MTNAWKDDPWAAIAARVGKVSLRELGSAEAYIRVCETVSHAARSQLFEAPSSRKEWLAAPMPLPPTFPNGDRVVHDAAVDLWRASGVYEVVTERPPAGTDWYCERLSSPASNARAEMALGKLFMPTGPKVVCAFFGNPAEPGPHHYPATWFTADELDFTMPMGKDLWRHYNPIGVDHTWFDMQTSVLTMPEWPDTLDKHATNIERFQAFTWQLATTYRTTRRREREKLARAALLVESVHAEYCATFGLDMQSPLTGRLRQQLVKASIMRKVNREV